MARRTAQFEQAADHLREAAQIYSAPQNRATLAENSETFDAAVAALLDLSSDNAAEAFELAQ